MTLVRIRKEYNNLLLLSLIFLTVVLFGCQSHPAGPDVKNIEVTTNLVRFEESLFSIDTLEIQKEVDHLISKYPDFSDVFFYQITNKPEYKDDVYQIANAFIRDSFHRALYHECIQAFPDLTTYQAEFEKAFQYFKYYFPEKEIPTIYSCITGFEVGSFTIGHEVLGIGLDFYLGQDFAMYPPDLFPIYIRRTMNADHMVAKTIQALVENYVDNPVSTRMIDIMIRNGIVLFIKEKLLPEMDKTILFEYTADQWKWLLENESNIWVHFLEEELLYENNYRKFQKLVTPSPNAPNMPPETPGRVANWMAYKIVSAYMKRNPNVQLKDLLQMLDGQKLLNASKYKPRRSI